MGRALRWAYKLWKAKRDGGAREMIRVVGDRVIRKGELQDHCLSTPDWIVRDVLFVNGVETIPHPYRYRVLHQMEQLRAAGYTVGEKKASELEPEDVLNGNVIVLYRVPYSEKVGQAIRMARSMNKTVIFDVDDLIVDTRYTDGIADVQKMSLKDRALYDEGVTRYGATLRMCDAATVSTNALQREISKIIPKVYVNRNCASERMAELSEDAWRKREAEAAEPDGKTRKKGNGELDGDVVIGYFSGTLTHNADFEMIQPALMRVMDENPRVKLLLMGELDLPEALAARRERVIQKPFVDWELLPEVIAGVDLNLAPVENTLFNEAKSENKWVEASLVKVATVASDMGPYAEMIEDGVNGWLADENNWYEKLTEAVRDGEKRKRIAENAYRYCREHCVTTENTRHIRDIYEAVRKPHAAFVLPSAEISGGIMVALRHACILQDAGWNVDLIAHYAKGPVWEEFGHTFSCISYADGVSENQSWYDLMVGTMWTTLDYIRKHQRVGVKAYLIQNYERDFYPLNDPQRLESEATYFLSKDWHYLTISRWCAEWLKEKYGQDAACMRNGMELERFRPAERDWQGRKIRILIEGDCAAEYKKVDESFRIAARLDPEKYEIWYMSYNAQPKEAYRFDRFLHAVPYDQVPQVYAECDILLKSSWLESFSYPPMEMMATGGACVLVQNGGNSEYVRDGENCLTYPLGDEEAAVRAIRRIAEDGELRKKLRENGLKTVQGRDWKELAEEIIECYLQLINNPFH